MDVITHPSQRPDILSENIRVHGKELTVYFAENINQCPGKCHYCGTSGLLYASQYDVIELIDENYVTLHQKTPLFNEAQAVLRKNRGHEIYHCNSIACEASHLKATGLSVPPFELF